MDGIVWTPWRTLLATEEMRPERQPSTPDPDKPQAQAGLVYESNPETGARSHVRHSGPKHMKGSVRAPGQRLRYFGDGTLDGVAPGDAVSPQHTTAAPGGYIFKFTPDARRDALSGQLYTLKIVARYRRSHWRSRLGAARSRARSRSTRTGRNRGGGDRLRPTRRRRDRDEHRATTAEPRKRALRGRDRREPRVADRSARRGWWRGTRRRPRLGP